MPLPIGAGAEFAYGVPLALCGRAAPGGCLIVPDGGASAARERSRLGEMLAFDTFDGRSWSVARVETNWLGTGRDGWYAIEWVPRDRAAGEWERLGIRLSDF